MQRRVNVAVGWRLSNMSARTAIAPDPLVEHITWHRADISSGNGIITDQQLACRN